MATRVGISSPAGGRRRALRSAAGAGGLLGVVLLGGLLRAQVGRSPPPAAALRPWPAAARPVSPAPTRLQLGPDLTLELAAGDVFAVTPTARHPLARSAPTGECRAISRHPFGTVFVAAERGLFVCDRDHLVLDGADLRDGVPPGAPVGVHCDAAGRVWLCSTQAFGVVDARFGFGRTFGTADGVPPGPYLGVSGSARDGDEDDGGVVLHTAAGAFVYRPDVGPPPRLVDPRSAAAAPRPAMADSAGSLPIVLEVTARGGATLRQRRRHHHLLRPIENATLRGLRPGHHTVEVHAVDRDLRRVVVARYRVEVPLPDRFDPRWLVPVAIGVALLVFAAALWSARESGWRRLRVGGLRTALVMVVGLQLLAATLGYGRSWPFVGFSMYTENWHEGDVLHRPWIHAITADGRLLPREPVAIGVVQDGYWQMLSEVVHGGDAEREALWQLVRRSQQHGGPRFVGYVLSDSRIRLTADGPVDAAPTVMVHYRPE